MTHKKPLTPPSPSPPSHWSQGLVIFKFSPILPLPHFLLRSTPEAQQHPGRRQLTGGTGDIPGEAAALPASPQPPALPPGRRLRASGTPQPPTVPRSPAPPFGPGPPFSRTLGGRRLWRRALPAALLARPGPAQPGPAAAEA